MRVVANEIAEVLEVIEHGRLDRAMVGRGESATLVDAIKSVSEIRHETLEGFWAEIARLARLLQPFTTALEALERVPLTWGFLAARTGFEPVPPP